MQNKSLQEKAWKQTYLVDRKQIDSSAKDIPKLFPFSITVAPWTDRISKLIAQNDQSEIKLGKEQKVIFQKLSQIGFDIQGFRQQLKNYDQTHQFLVKIQNGSQNILSKLQQFRGKMGTSYEQLADQQQKLKDELDLLSKKIEYMGQDVYEQQKENVKNSNKEVKVWENRERKGMKSVSPKDDQPLQRIDIVQLKMKEKEREVDLIEKQINSLGRNLGWPQQDHNDFISIWNRASTKNYFQIEQELQAYFAFYTAQQIQEHMNKYLKYKKLTEEKKEAIIKFKTLRQQKKMQELRMLNLQRNKSKEEKQKNQQRKRQEKQQQEMKEKIIGWKELKLRQKKEQEQRRKQQELQKHREEAMKRRQKIEQNKQKVQYWKQKQAEKQQQLRRVQSARKQPVINKEVQQRIKAREQQLIMKKIEIVNEKKRQQQMLKQKQVRLKQQKFIKYSHVTNKLDHKTTAIKQKQRQKFDGKDRKEANTFGGQLIMTGVRATPAWMKGL